MLNTQYVPGSVCMLDYGSPDIPATVAFYSGTLGWSHHPVGEGYGFFEADGKQVAGLGPFTEEGAGPAWMVYFHTADVDATAKAVEQAGGAVRVPPGDVMTEGRTAQFTDPAGAEFAVWQPGDFRGLGMVTEPGSLGWVELYVADPAAIRAFYRSVFDWRIEDMPMGDLSYPVIFPAEGDEQSGQGGIVQLQPGDRAHWLPYFEVPDCDAAAARAQDLGGTIRVPAGDIEGVGRMAFLTDPHGAPFAIITSTTP